MKILKSNQYNQGIGKYKLLSSTAGVGSIIATKVGSYVLISDINKWKFIKWANSKVELVRSNNSDDRRIYEITRTEMSNRGFDFIDDQRFIRFIRTEKELNNLVCLIGVPHMALNESFNTPNWKNHPIKTALEKTGDNGISSDYMIVGTHFPKWFKNRKGELREISKWRDMWEKEGRNNGGTPTIHDFAPPRDASDFIKEYRIKNIEGQDVNYREYRELEQTNLTLICPNGHLSDVPWSKFLSWKTLKETFQINRDDNGENLFDIEPCCGNPNLVWTESKTKSEGYGSIFIECKSCGLGSGISKDKPKINLEGINSLQPNCKGQKPWEIELDNANTIPFEKCYIRGEQQYGREKMQISLVTANNMYYANGFSSLFVPMHLAENITIELLDAIEILEERYNKRNSNNSISKNEFWTEKVASDFDEFLADNAIVINTNNSQFENSLKMMFLNFDDNQAIDSHEEYRWQEYRCFSQNSSISDIEKNKGLNFRDIELSTKLKPFFAKIQQVEELKVTNIQLDFTRVKPKERIVQLNDSGEKVVEEVTIGQNIFAVKKEELFVLPANETYGEGLFFQFNDEGINRWIKDNLQQLNDRFLFFLNRNIDTKEQGAGIKQKIKNNGIKHFLIHSFSHLMMRELEFSCGYPTASLKERLYISNTPNKIMSGVLIYTAEGSEGSMGGLVSQGEPEKIQQIIKKGFERGLNCSSDPLCWESDGQGIFDLNLSACFSCSLVAETACEEMNLGLDRRVLIDEEFGYFKDIL
ncbi:MAG TPA: DUF1998 domain-containing protein [Dysgonomonas sp.]|uniref:DUF1998 domain-containing protein n=1 Tax=unclassified Dysgonomonas TaxID=2630389 RepID=UPI0025C5B594|nr:MULTISPECIES: DUF1998 domain-containing protein [unclassified Dysgonomonas]HML66463.1 DUF1998 domain-containing protein [Dysgonomonas sp.]